MSVLEQNNVNNEHTETNMHFYSSVIAWIHFVLHHSLKLIQGGSNMNGTDFFLKP